jgi:hypothetical protein
MAMEFWARFRGKAIHPEHAGDYAKLRELSEGELVKVRITKPRRAKHHRLFFAVIQAAFDNWPELHDEQFENADHLRAWLTVKAGYRDLFEEKLEASEADPKRIAGFMGRAMIKIKSAGGYGFFINHKQWVVMFTPKSISWSKLSQDDFSPISDAVFQIIEQETCIPIEALKREAERDIETAKQQIGVAA